MSDPYANNKLHPWKMPLESQAKAYHDILEAIFDYADDNFEPKGLGLMTKEKEITMLEKSGQEENSRLYSSITAPVTTRQYMIMGCAFQMLAVYDPNTSPYDYREPNQPGLTKQGWIKYQVISMLLEGNSDSNYEILQSYVTTFNLQVKNTNERALFHKGRYPPLPEISTVQWYARSLASALNIRNLEGIQQDIQALIKELQNPQPNCQETMTGNQSMTNCQETMDPNQSMANAKAYAQNRLAEQMLYQAHSEKMLAKHIAHTAIMQGISNARSYIR